MYKVKKKDGSIEDFMPNKLMTGILKAGGNQENADQVLEQVETWLSTLPADCEVTSAEIRAKALETLVEVNPEVGANFESYKKPAALP